jgi:DNA polymerase III epsilon subunit
MLKTLTAEYILFDVETTGLSPLEGDRIIEIAALRLKKGVIAERFTSFVNPCRPLSIGAQEINGITEEMVQDAPTAAEVLPKIIDFAGGACLVAHNASFDIKFLSYELALVGRKLREETPVLDTVRMARAFLPYLASYRLGSLAHSLGVAVTETHRAMADVELLTAIFKKLVLMAGDYNIHQLPELISQFSVEKPSFRMVSDPQPSLF